MKRIFLFLAATLLCVPAFSFAQDAATEERFNQLNAKIEALIEAKNAQNKRIEELAKQLREVQEQQSKPNASYATQDDVKTLAAKLQEIDEKRQSDDQRILRTIQQEIEGLGKTLASSSKKPSPSATSTTSTAPVSDRGFEHVVKQGDTLDGIVRAYREQKIKVTVEDILNANKGLRPESMRIGQKIFIPLPQ